jgi:Zn-dependent protease with chaperone function
MNFFEDQEIAKKKTRKLVLLFFLSVMCTALALTIVIGFIISAEAQMDYSSGYGANASIFDHWKLLISVFGFVACSIFIATFIKIASLGKGGEHVAKMLGATKVRRAGSDVDLKKYINIVQEMSIASGIPVPHIYIMENEPAINAFAAGYEIDDCVVCVTRGAIKNLTRDELQGVVAHEFSHIFNGDMKLNIKLIGYLYGLLALSEMGRVILESGSRRSRYSSSRDKGRGQLFLVGIALFIIGGLGYILGSLIKSSVSKQREFLADASAVQYTRNPFGIGGALLKIFKLSEGSTILASKAEEASHMFFGSVMQMTFETHPSVEERLEKIYPNRKWVDIKEDEIIIPEPEKNDVEKEKDEANEIFTQDAVKVATAGAILSSFAAKKEKIGEVSRDSVEAAHSLINSVPYSVKDEIQTVEGAKKLILSFFEGNSSFKDGWRYPIFELGLGTLDELSKNEKSAFVMKVKKIILSDKKISPSEFIHYFLIKNKLLKNSKFLEKSASKADMKKAYLNIADFAKNALQDDRYEFKTKDIDHGLKILAISSPKVKKQVLDKIIDIVNEDERVTALEQEFVRLVCQSFRVPYPL